MAGGIIPETTFKVVNGVFFGIGILAAIARTFIRFRLNQRLDLSDGLLFTSCVCFIATTILLYKMVPDIYFFQSLARDPAAVKIPLDIVQKVGWFQRSDSAYLFVTWTAIYLVKASFLSFFRRLIDRLGTIVSYWKVVVAVTAVTFVFCASDGFIACPKSGLAATDCANGALLDRAVLLSGITISLDIMTDIMIVAIPIWVLWQVKMKNRQKAGLGAFLCLNICMAIIACVRVSGIRYQGIINHTWGYFWQQMEVSVAIAMFSFTAFRSAFVSDRSKVNGRKARPWYSSPGRRLRGHKVSSQPGDQEQLPSIPSATLTGMRTFIRGSRRISNLDAEIAYENMEGILLHNREDAMVAHGLAP